MTVLENIKKIRKEKSITQQVIADSLGFDVSNFSRIEKGEQHLYVDQLEKIAKILDVDITYLFTYPKKYVDSELVNAPERISVTFEISPDKRDVLLNLVTGDKK